MIEFKFDKKHGSAIAYDNSSVIGICEFIEKNNCWNIIHTEVDNNYQGRGVASKLVNQVILEARKNNKEIIADCSYARSIIEYNKASK